MGRAKFCRRFATECLALTDTVADAGDRGLLIAMATRWYELAEQAAKITGLDASRDGPPNSSAPAHHIGIAA
jgi:hypothetical protein